jgi:hypothetical protein
MTELELLEETNDPRVKDRTQRQGLNLLGVDLTRVREVLLWEGRDG